MSLFITFEGTEGAGKSTQIERVKEYIESLGFPVLVVREPGSTKLGDQLRQILLDPENKQICMRTEILLYAASRAQLIEEMVLPALQAGKMVLCDRYVDSSIAYQGYGAQWDIQEVVTVNKLATGGLVPDRTYLLDVPLHIGQDRIHFRNKRKDRMELKEDAFHRRVKQGYAQLAAEHKRIKVISGEQSIDQVFSKIKEDLIHLLAKNSKISDA